MPIQQLDSPQVCLIFASTILGLLDTVKNRRADVLGGWDKVTVGQGVLKKTDPAIEHIREMEDRFFAVTADLAKLCGKMSVEVLRKNGKKPVTLINAESRDYIYEISGAVIDELQHFVDTAANGREPGLTYLEGYNDALDEVEHLMFRHNVSRQKAVDTLREAHKSRALKEAA